MNKKTKPPTWANSIVALANALGVTRQSVHHWLSEPNNPGRASNGKYNVPLWKSWAASVGKDAGDSPELVKLKARHLTLQIEKLEFRLRVARREFVPAKLVQKWGGDLGAAIRKVVTQLHLAAPNLAGLSTPEIEARLIESEDEILTQLSRLGEEQAGWKAESDELASDDALDTDFNETP